MHVNLLTARNRMPRPVLAAIWLAGSDSFCRCLLYGLVSRGNVLKTLNVLNKAKPSGLFLITL